MEAKKASRVPVNTWLLAHAVCQPQARFWEPKTNEPWPLAPGSSCLAESLGPAVQRVTVDPLPL